MSASAGLAASISGLVGVAVVVSVGAGVAVCSVAGELQPESSKEQAAKAMRSLGVTDNSSVVIFLRRKLLVRPLRQPRPQSACAWNHPASSGAQSLPLVPELSFCWFLPGTLQWRLPG